MLLGLCTVQTGVLCSTDCWWGQVFTGRQVEIIHDKDQTHPPTPISRRQTLCYVVVHINFTFIPEFLTISGARGLNPMGRKNAMEAGSLCEEYSINDLSPLKIVTLICNSFILCFISWLRCGRSPELRYVPTQDYQGLPQQKVSYKCFSTLWLWAPAFYK